MVSFTWRTVFLSISTLVVNPSGDVIAVGTARDFTTTTVSVTSGHSPLTFSPLYTANCSGVSIIDETGESDDS
jgi:hypothetical protein